MRVPRVAKAQPWAGISERFQRCSSTTAAVGDPARGPLEMQREVLLSTRAPGCTNVQHFRMPIADFRLPIDL